MVDTIQFDDSVLLEAETYLLVPFTPDPTSPEDVDEMNVSIYGAEGIVENAPMIRAKEGSYYYVWDTHGNDPGEYAVIYRAVKGTTLQVEVSYIRIIRPEMVS